ncbi:MAG: ACT domain-containing protein [Clostridia bacterium]|nr:ACT domain-containing protein [Clostridia bacterium]
MKKDSYLLVNSKILPSVFEGVVRAKEFLKNGTASNNSQAAKLAGISRSAFYKYRDYVFKYDCCDSQTINLAAILSDRAGVFSAMTRLLYENGANIITVNQDTPVNGTAVVTLAVKTDKTLITIDELLKKLKDVDGIISIREV